MLAQPTQKSDYCHIEAASMAVRDVLSANRLPLNNEKRLQRSLAQAMTIHGMSFIREYDLSGGDVVDFMLDGGVVIECKLKGSGGSKRNIYRQLKRYAQHDEVTALILVANIAMGLPPAIEGKPTFFMSLGQAWL